MRVAMSHACNLLLQRREDHHMQLAPRIIACRTHCEPRPMITQLPLFPASSITLGGELLQRIPVHSGIGNSSHVHLRPTMPEPVQHAFPPGTGLLLAPFGPVAVDLAHGAHLSFNSWRSTNSHPSRSATRRPTSAPPLPHPLAMVTALNILSSLLPRTAGPVALPSPRTPTRRM